MSVRVLFAGPPDSGVLSVLHESGDVVVQTTEPISPDDLDDVDFLVSHGYRHILRRPVLDRVPGRALNLHISLLPWGRGADPNFWSHVEGTPSGVTIHLIDEGIDTGAIIAQEPVRFDGDDTLRTSYALLQTAMIDLFRREWPRIRTGQFVAVPQTGQGTEHRAAELAAWPEALPDGWDTRLADLPERTR